MSVGYGFGMLALGMTAIMIGALIIYFVINKIQKDQKKEEEERKHREKIHGYN